MSEPLAAILPGLGSPKSPSNKCLERADIVSYACKDSGIAIGSLESNEKLSSGTRNEDPEVTFNSNPAEMAVHCSIQGTPHTLHIRPDETVLEFKTALARRMNCKPSEVSIICKGKVISNDVHDSLEKCGVKSGCKVLVILRPVGQSWFYMMVHFPVMNRSSIPIRMHSSSPTLNVKKQINELMGIPIDFLSLFLADGNLMHDDVSLRDYGFQDGAHVYCLANKDPLSKEISVGVGPEINGVPIFSVKMNLESLMQEIVHQHSEKDLPHPKSTSKPASAGKSTASERKTPRGAFSGLRKGFLFAEPAPKARRKGACKSAEEGKRSGTGSSPSAAVAPVGNGDSRPTSFEAGHAAPEAESAAERGGGDPSRTRSAADDGSLERARQAGIPESLRTGRTLGSGGMCAVLEQLHKALREALAQAAQNQASSPQPSAVGATSTPAPAPQAPAAESDSAVAAAPSVAAGATQGEGEDPATRAAARGGGAARPPPVACRCAACGKKVGLTAVSCRCGRTFCARHRYAEAHACTFDYKAFQRSR